MTSIPLAVVLIPFFLFLILFFIFSIFNLFHLIHYGPSTAGKFAVIAVYVAGTLTLLGGSYLTLAPYDWERPITSTVFLKSVTDVNLFEIPNLPARDLEDDDTAL
ncbi:TPA: hypothetical protein DDZ10_00430 [Candidatus Uhrbacteria bacterium]|nr:MAG: hypothetical protein A3D69_03915 [Candidatus Uhrbacteria bacterium RIFCSPHIGHO2_02_FULL_54_11]HBL39127.1 hypothetical protein [Candidatus Uhrbacteria bacterium]